jgi:hypothetical protein
MIPLGLYSQDLTYGSQTHWKSSDKEKATISNEGLATGKKACSSNIEGEFRKKTDATELTVTGP